MTIHAAIANYAMEAFWSYYRNAPVVPTEVYQIELDIRDNYKQANLADLFPSLLNFSEDAYGYEASYINDLRHDIAQRVYGLLTSP